MPKNKNLSQKWIENLKILDIAFQPILNIHTGKTYAVEALLRNYESLGFKSIFALFDRVYSEGILYSFDLALREKALKKYTSIEDYQNIKLFYNLDNRLFSDHNSQTCNTTKLLKKLKIKKENLCFEISERHEISGDFDLERVLQHYKSENFSIAIDDFGVGYSGLKLLYDSTPDIIKIDRFFLQDLEKSLKKRLMFRSITHLAIQLGIKVVAEGVETKAELLTSKEIGCHYVQGYLIQKPTLQTREISSSYAPIREILKSDRRAKKNSSILNNYVEQIEPLQIKTKMNIVIDYFKSHKSTPIVPIISSSYEPIGVLHESKIKDFLYSPYGISLLLNEENKSKLKDSINLYRIIQLFADILRKELKSNIFKAHIGGDDFFVAFAHEDEIDIDKCLDIVKLIIKKFSDSAREFYSQEDKDNNYIISKNRDAIVSKFPLLSVSASLLEIPKSVTNRDETLVDTILAKQKKVAKYAANKFAISSLV